MSKRLIQFFVVVLLLVNTTLLIWLNKRHERMPVPTATAKEFIIKELQLNPKQTEQYNVLKDEHFNAMQQLNRQSAKLKEQLFDYISAPVADSLLINAVSQKTGGIESLKDKTTMYHFRKLRSILNKQQQQKFDTVIKEVLRMMARLPGPPERRGRGGENQPPDGPPPPG